MPHQVMMHIQRSVLPSQPTIMCHQKLFIAPFTAIDTISFESAAGGHSKLDLISSLRCVAWPIRRYRAGAVKLLIATIATNNNGPLKAVDYTTRSVRYDMVQSVARGHPKLDLIRSLTRL
eukprot:scaffold26869_cov89-Skeletonema_dohrnii-CCMP3373.AAC.1